MNRAVGAQLVFLPHFSQGVALGWYELTPLASQKNVQAPRRGFPAARPRSDICLYANDEIVIPNSFLIHFGLL
jgi:hypothetical protein